MTFPAPWVFPDSSTIRSLSQFRNVAREMDIPGGIHVIEPEPEKLQQRIDEGYRFIAYSLDIRMLDVACRKGLHHIKE